MSAVLVTGVAGFIGCHLAERLLAAGADQRRATPAPQS
ncbi:MAG: NAD-dependent epimerase/dehydratase family protein [Hyphomonadaceae bacterium]|nr:NAD-dependent epimerase/dehydratase family protein [Hyphomonadaceae bacterium]